VWVVWASDSGSAQTARAIVIDAQTGRTVAPIPDVATDALAGLTDRSRAGCAPPYGVLTRSEATYLDPLLAGTSTVMKLVTLGTIAELPPYSSFANCQLQECEASAPVWVFIATALDHRYLRGTMGGVTGPVGPTGTTTTVEPGSWSSTALDARTGPQVTNLGGGADGAGTPPAAVLALPDLAPQ